MKQYAERDIVDQDLRNGGAYMRHVQAMTAEALHSKSDIAAELAHRDIVIDKLAMALRVYGEHSFGCENEERDEPSTPGYPGKLKGLPCTCGFHTALDFAPQRVSKP